MLKKHYISHFCRAVNRFGVRANEYSRITGTMKQTLWLMCISTVILAWKCDLYIGWHGWRGYRVYLIAQRGSIDRS